MLRSIRDVNEPKFLAPDLPLFAGILSDLFPGVELPPTDYSSLDAALTATAAKLSLQVRAAGCTRPPVHEGSGRGARRLTRPRRPPCRLQATPVFMDKAHQLYEMILVRHGLMLVGLSYGAKTCLYRCLAGALALLETQGLLEEHKCGGWGSACSERVCECGYMWVRVRVRPTAHSRDRPIPRPSDTRQHTAMEPDPDAERRASGASAGPSRVSRRPVWSGTHSYSQTTRSRPSRRS